MKKTLISMLVLGGLAMAQTEPTVLTLTTGLPTALQYNGANINAGANLTTTINYFAGEGHASYSAGSYIATNNGVVAYGTTTEGQLTGTAEDGYQLQIWGRSGKSGETLVYVVDSGVNADYSYVTDIKFSVTKGSITPDLNCNPNLTTAVAVVDTTTQTVLASVIGSTANQKGMESVATLSFNKTWSDDYVLVALVRGTGGGDENNFGTKIALTVAPEPATATLSLLALAGLAARRRRH